LAAAPGGPRSTLNGTLDGEDLQVTFEADGDYLVVRKVGDDAVSAVSTAVDINEPPVDAPVALPTANRAFLFDPDYTPSLTVTGTGEVTEIRDVLDPTVAFTANTTTEAPTQGTKLGRAVLDFDGTRFMWGSTAPALDDFFAQHQAVRSVHAVVFPPSTFPGDQMMIVGGANTDFVEGTWCFGLDGDWNAARPIILSWTTGGDTTCWNTTASLTPDTLTLVSLVEDAAGNVTFYLNGVAVPADGGVQPIQAYSNKLGTWKPRLGAIPWFGADAKKFIGSIGAVAVYSIAHIESKLTAIWDTAQQWHA
jgi:hypothetical protein